jgi:perosamine synthetase
MTEDIRSIPALQVDLSTYKDEILEEVGKVIDSGRLILGPYTEYIENRWAEDHGKRYGIAVNSDTAALESVLQCIDIKDSVVLMPQTAFFACANITLRLGGKVCLVDIEPHNGIMPTSFQWEEAIEFCKQRGYHISAAMMVYSAGQCSPSQVKDIGGFVERGIPVLEDCAHCHGGKYADGRYIGSEGTFATWSTYATKLIHSGEGGMIVTDSTAATNFLRVYRNYGRKTTDGVFTECASPLGYNWRMTEMQAAILKVMWGHLPDIISARRKVADVYDQYFPPQPFDQNEGRPYSLCAPQITRNLYRYTVMIPGMTFESNRRLYNYLSSCNPKITLQEKSNHMPLAMHAGYDGHPHVISAPRQFSGAMQYCLEHICLPIYPKLSEDDAEIIADSVMKWWEQWSKTGRR